MKKIFIVYGLLFSLFFAGNSFAQSNEINFYNDQKNEICNSNSNRLNKVCEKTLENYLGATTWVEENNNDFLKTIDIESRKNEVKETLNDDKIDIYKKISEEENNANEKFEKEFYKGVKKLMEISDDFLLGSNNRKYSPIEIEKMLIEAGNYFEKAEKLARKPQIHSGGILPGPKYDEDATDYTVQKFLTKLLNLVMTMMFSMGVIIIIIGGLMFLFSAGDSEQVTKARSTLFWGIVGVAIGVLSYALVKFVVGIDFGF